MLSFAIQRTLWWLLPDIPAALTSVVLSVLWVLSYVPWYELLFIAFGIALPNLLDAIKSRGKTAVTYGRELRASLRSIVPNHTVRSPVEKKPGLGINFDRNDLRCIHETFLDKDPGDKVLYVAVWPRALKPMLIKGCKGFLNTIWELGEDDLWHETSFVNVQQLEWAILGFVEEVDIDDKTNQTLNIFYVKKRDPRIHLLTPRTFNKDKDIFHIRYNKVRRFDIVVRNRDGISAEISLRVQLGNEWNDVRVEQI